MHTGERPFVCDFPGCGMSFLHSSRLPPHKKTYHGIETAPRKRLSANTKKYKLQRIESAPANQNKFKV